MQGLGVAASHAACFAHSNCPSSSSVLFVNHPGLRTKSRAIPRLGTGEVAARLGEGLIDGTRRSYFSPSQSSFASTLRRPCLQQQAAKKTFSSFDDMLNQSDVPVLVDFYAIWCGPCQYMVSILNEVGQTLKDHIRVVKIDTEKYPNLASRYDVHALPTFVLFQNGKPIDRFEGALPAENLIHRIQDVLPSSRAKVNPGVPETKACGDHCCHK